MTNEEYRNAIQFVAHVIELVTDPVAMSRLKSLKADIDGTTDWVQQFNPVEGYERTATHGTCPTCGRTYRIGNDESLRRHKDVKYGRQKCEFDKQLPAEIIPAILLIAELGGNGEGESDGRTQHPGTDIV